MTAPYDFDARFDHLLQCFQVSEVEFVEHVMRTIPPSRLFDLDHLRTALLAYAGKTR